MNARRMREFGAMVMVGDGVIALVAPKRHSLLWTFGPEGYRRLMEGFSERPGVVRALAAAEVACGLWLALRQYENG